MSSLDGYTPTQQQLITAGEGAIAVLAGPGCGKTTSLAGRITFLVHERGVDPASILALSFTTEAARRLRREVARQLGDRAQDVAILTLHALGRRVIDTWAGHLGYDDRPTIVHHDEARALLGAVAADQGWDLASLPVSELAAAVDRCRLLPDDQARRSDPLASLADAYEQRLLQHGTIDFVAMLALPLRLFRADDRSLRVLQDAYRYVLADEGQDLDGTQWALLELLAGCHGNLLVAGDVAQAIFGWRGADPLALHRFAERCSSASTIVLDKNHRSTGHLVAFGNAISDLLAYRPPLVTDNPPGPFPRLLVAEDEHAEAHFVAQQIGALLDRGLLPHPGEAAVLFRTRQQADVVAGALRGAGLPYRLHGHGDLFATRVVLLAGCHGKRDMLAYLRLATNPADRPALARIVDTPPRGLGRLAATLLEEPATAAELPGRAADFGPAAVASAATLMATIFDLHAEASRGTSPATLLDRALDRSGYRAWLERHPDGIRRLQTLGRLRALVARAEVPVGEWLDAVAVGEELGAAEEEATHLSSVHLAKGREFLATFVLGTEEGLLPHARAILPNGDTDEGALEEELRVLYVALTRARERLFISAAARARAAARPSVGSPHGGCTRCRRSCWPLRPEWTRQHGPRSPSGRSLQQGGLLMSARSAHAPSRRGIDTEALKLAHPIEEVVARYGIELRRQGQALVGRCPLHHDRGRPKTCTSGPLRGAGGAFDARPAATSSVGSSWSNR